MKTQSTSSVGVGTNSLSVVGDCLNLSLETELFGSNEKREFGYFVFSEILNYFMMVDLISRSTECNRSTQRGKRSGKCSEATEEHTGA